MTTTLSTTKADYLERVAAGLADLSEDDREEVIQDLRAHLAEVDESEVEVALGSPSEFVAEFRASAGLDEKPGKARWWSYANAHARLVELCERLAELSRWQSWRPVWIWMRGWLVVSTIAVLSGGTAFHPFPIPAIEESLAIGLLLVGTATFASLWLDRGRTEVRSVFSILFNTLAVVLLAVSLASAAALSRNYLVDEPYLPDQLVAPDGVPISNIYAYDLDGNPVEVLLFDQDGRPIRSLPGWVYEEAERNPAFGGPLDYWEGAVDFPRDEFGRIIPNLYPLELYRYGEYGLEPVRPPSLGFPQANEADPNSNGGIVTTTTIGDSFD